MAVLDLATAEMLARGTEGRMGDVTKLPNRDAEATSAACNETRAEPNGEVVIFPRLNLRHIWRLWAEDCIESGLAAPKPPDPKSEASQ